jgi:hypothetical protein
MARRVSNAECMVCGMLRTTMHLDDEETEAREELVTRVDSHTYFMTHGPMDPLEWEHVMDPAGLVTTGYRDPVDVMLRMYPR